MRNAANKIAALGIATALAVSALAPTAAFAAPVGTRAAQLEMSFADSVIDVQWRRGRWVAPAIAGAIISGAIIAGSRPYGYYDGPYGYYDGPPPSGYYYRAPPRAYYEPNPRGGMRQCWIEAGPAQNTGYWSPC